MGLLALTLRFSIKLSVKGMLEYFCTPSISAAVDRATVVPLKLAQVLGGERFRDSGTEGNAVHCFPLQFFHPHTFMAQPPLFWFPLHS